MSGHQQQCALGQQLFSGEHFTFFFDAEQQADKIIAFMLAPLWKECAEIFRQIEETLLCLSCALYRSSRVPKEIGEGIRPDLKISLIRTRYTKHLGNHDDWKRIGKLAHEFHLALTRRLVQQCIDGLLNTRSHPLNHVWRKLFVQEFA